MKMYESVIKYIATLKSAKLYIKALWQSLMVGFRSHLSSLPTPHNLHSLPRSARKDGRPTGTSSRTQSLEPLQFLPEVLKSIARTLGCTARLILGSIHTSWHSLLSQRHQ